MRGRAYLSTPNLARPQLELALEIAESDPQSAAYVRNLLGVVYFEMAQPHLALEQHLLCWASVQASLTKDLAFRVNVYGNLANDYWALNQPQLAIGVYKEAVPILEDLNDTDKLAKVFWGMTMAYAKARDWPYARLYAISALDIYEVSENRLEGASICINLAETMLDDQRYDDAEELLGKAERLIAGTDATAPAGNRAILSYLRRDYADLARRQGQYEKAIQHAEQSVALAQDYYEAMRSTEARAEDQSGQEPTRTLAEALQMRGLVEEEGGNRELADRRFEQALAILGASGFEETKHAVTLSYAKILQARGEFEKSVDFYRIAAEGQGTGMRKGR